MEVDDWLVEQDDMTQAEIDAMYPESQFSRDEE